jgi:hypothetical protein
VVSPFRLRKDVWPTVAVQVGDEDLIGPDPALLEHLLVPLAARITLVSEQVPGIPHIQLGAQVVG